MLHKDKLPVPENKEDRKRWEETRKRRRLLEGFWEYDLTEFVSKHLGINRADMIGVPSTSSNMFKSVVQQLSIMYNADPIVQNPFFTEESEQYFKGIQVWSKGQAHNKNVVGLRESLIRIHWNDPDQVTKEGPYLRLVTPDYVTVKTKPNNPDSPVEVREALERVDPSDDTVKWFWDVWNIEDPENPYFKIVTADDKEADVTESFMPGSTGIYPWINLDTGQPFLPWVLYHAEDTGKSFNYKDWHELVNGTLEIGLLWTYWSHIIKNASWAQKYAIDAELMGTNNTGSGKSARTSVTTDPTSILLFRSSNAAGGGVLSAFQQSADPKQVSEAIVTYALSVADNIGLNLNPTDVQRVSPQSGIAIKLKSEGLRKMQRLFEPQFRRADIELLEKVAMVSNIFSTGAIPALPTSGYTIQYQTLAKDNDEILKELEIERQLLALGLRSKIDLMMKLQPELTREQAERKIKEIQLENSGLVNPFLKESIGG